MMVDVLLIIGFLYCIGAVVGGVIAFVQTERKRKVQPLTLMEEVEALEKTMMWTLFWWFCLWNWAMHRNALK